MDLEIWVQFPAADLEERERTKATQAQYAEDVKMISRTYRNRRAPTYSEDPSVLLSAGFLSVREMLGELELSSLVEMQVVTTERDTSAMFRGGRPMIGATDIIEAAIVYGGECSAVSLVARVQQCPRSTEIIASDSLYTDHVVVIAEDARADRELRQYFSEKDWAEVLK